MSKLIGIIYSPGYGAGWSTWGDDRSCLDQELAEAIESKDFDKVLAVAEKNWPDQYAGGLRDCKVEWVESGTKFIVDEYDGNESITFYDGDFWMVAE